MKLALRILAGTAVVSLLGWFAYIHSSQRVDLSFGLFTLRGLPLSFVLYAAVVLGMLIMLGVGVWSDLRTKRLPDHEQGEIAPDLFAGVDAGDEVVLEELDN